MENVELALTIPATVTRQRYPEPNLHSEPHTHPSTQCHPAHATHVATRDSHPPCVLGIVWGTVYGNPSSLLTLDCAVRVVRGACTYPAVVVHRIWVCATTTEHTALSVRPALVLAYTADTGAEVSPKLLPTRVADDPPAVARVTSGLSEWEHDRWGGGG